MHEHGERRAQADRAAAPPSPARPDALQALQRNAGNQALSRAVVQRSTVQSVLSGTGSPLPSELRTEMEARLGADFSDVRLHTGQAAQRSAEEIGARAYTSGSHVVLGAAGTDRHTLAHELTHVIQQRSGPVSGTATSDGFSLSDPSDAFERAAEANAARALRGPVPEPDEQ